MLKLMVPVFCFVSFYACSVDNKRGDTGPTGDVGPQGEQGPAGTDGKNGVNGKDGKDGISVFAELAAFNSACTGASTEFVGFVRSENMFYSCSQDRSVRSLLENVKATEAQVLLHGNWERVQNNSATFSYSRCFDAAGVADTVPCGLKYNVSYDGKITRECTYDLITFDKNLSKFNRKRTSHIKSIPFSKLDNNQISEKLSALDKTPCHELSVAGSEVSNIIYDFEVIPNKQILRLTQGIGSEYYVFGFSLDRNQLTLPSTVGAASGTGEAFPFSFDLTTWTKKN
jgi:hypothetical protein